MRLRQAVLYFSIAFLGYGCNYNRLKEPEISNSMYSLPADQRVNLSYAFVAQRVFTPKCISCHGSSGGISLESYASVTADKNIERIKTSVFESHTMPKQGSLEFQEMAVLWTWIEMGAPEQAPIGGGIITPVPLAPTYASISQNIFQAKCITCHSPGNPGQRIPLGKDDLLNSPLDLVLPGNADESGLVIALERMDDKRMPPAKDGYAALKDEEKSAIREWIQNGAKD